MAAITPGGRLTAREAEILRLKTVGQSNREIVRRLFVNAGGHGGPVLWAMT